MLMTAIAARTMKEMRNASQKRLNILGTSMKKFERSTSFFVAPHVMLYENMWARSAVDR